MLIENARSAYAKGSMLLLAFAVAASCSVRRGVGRDRCYPYLPKPGGKCPTACESIDDCAGSRGPADFAKNGWPLDCIKRECVPLPPDAVQLE